MVPVMEARTLITALEGAGYRLTGPRRALASLIVGRTGHFTAGDLVVDAKEHRLGVGRATIFRTLEVLESLGSLERLDLPSGDHAYVVCQRSHHHHVVCSSCGRSTEIDDTGLRAVVDRIASRTGYQVVDHRLELFGLCALCQTKRKAAS
jgi:Fur family ferric uptake transcriptional regulator